MRIPQLEVTARQFGASNLDCVEFMAAVVAQCRDCDNGRFYSNESQYGTARQAAFGLVDERRILKPFGHCDPATAWRYAPPQRPSLTQGWRRVQLDDGQRLPVPIAGKCGDTRS